MDRWRGKEWRLYDLCESVLPSVCWSILFTVSNHLFSYNEYHSGTIPDIIFYLSYLKKVCLSVSLFISADAKNRNNIFTYTANGSDQASRFMNSLNVVSKKSDMRELKSKLRRVPSRMFQMERVSLTRLNATSMSSGPSGGSPF